MTSKAGKNRKAFAAMMTTARTPTGKVTKKEKRLDLIISSGVCTILQAIMDVADAGMCALAHSMHKCCAAFCKHVSFPRPRLAGGGLNNEHGAHG